MRLCLLSGLGLILTACGLSMNPDLPSAKDDDSPTFGGDGDDNLSIGDGDAVGPVGEGASEGFGGSGQPCPGLGGEGGVPSCGGAR